MNYKKPLLEGANKVFGKRIIAGVIDVALWVAIFIVAALNFGTTTTTVNDGMTSKQLSLTGWPGVVYFVAELAYFTLMEWGLGGTVGKLLMRLKVVNAKGGRINLQESLIRNVLRIVDGFPYVIPYVVGLVAVSAGNTKQRLGDKAAKTLVVGR